MRKHTGWILGLVVIMLTSGVWLTGCGRDKDKGIKNTSLEIGRLVYDQLKTLPPDAQKEFINRFNNIPPETKKEMAGNFVKHTLQPGQPNPENLLKRLRNMSPEERQNVIRKLHENHPEILRALRQHMMQHPNMPNQPFQGKQMMNQWGPGNRPMMPGGNQPMPPQQERMREMFPGVTSALQAFRANVTPQEMERIKGMLAQGIKRFMQLSPQEQATVIKWELGKLQMLLGMPGPNQPPPHMQPPRHQQRPPDSGYWEDTEDENDWEDAWLEDDLTAPAPEMENPDHYNTAGSEDEDDDAEISNQIDEESFASDID